MNDARETEIRSISTDTRTLQKGDVYLALRGENHNGHNYITTAAANGAVACIVEQNWYRKNGNVVQCPLLVVRDTVVAYGAIANLYRRQFNIPVIGITGSNGKTTTKEMVASVLRTKYSVLSTSGNYNNHIGVPNTLLQLNAGHQVAVVELGTNQPSDIEYLCRIAEPSHAIITNIGSAHLERLQSKAMIAREKMTLYDAVGEAGFRYINNDDEYTSRYHAANGTNIRFGYTEGSDVRILECSVNNSGNPRVKFFSPAVSKKEFQLGMRTVGLPGAYAAAIALAVGMTFDCAVYKMKEAIKSFESPGKRLKATTTHGVTVLDDTYNANPDSVRAAIDTIASMKNAGAKIVVLGDMLELGAHAKDEHRKIGDYLVGIESIEYVLTYGKNAREIYNTVKTQKNYAEHFGTKERLAQALLPLIDEGDIVMVKGSRGMDMTIVVDEILRTIGTEAD